MQPHGQIVWITFTIIGLVMVFVIIRAEEAFLSARFGKDWDSYASKARRLV